MTEPVLLNNLDHGDLRVRLERGALYGDAVNQVTVFATEFEALQREYAIVFRRDAAGRFRAVVLLGLALLIALAFEFVNAREPVP